MSDEITLRLVAIVEFFPSIGSMDQNYDWVKHFNLRSYIIDRLV